MADVSMVQVLPLDEWVLNTEAHPLPIQGSKRSMELQHLVLTPPTGIDLEGRHYAAHLLRHVNEHYAAQLAQQHAAALQTVTA